jgi:hypothetical protein
MSYRYHQQPGRHFTSRTIIRGSLQSATDLTRMGGLSHEDVTHRYAGAFHFPFCGLGTHDVGGTSPRGVQARECWGDGQSLSMHQSNRAIVIAGETAHSVNAPLTVLASRSNLRSPSVNTPCGAMPPAEKRAKGELLVAKPFLAPPEQ